MTPTGLWPLFNLVRGRPVLGIFEITLKCNSACGYCHLPHNQEQPKLSRAEIRRIFKALYADGMRHLLIQGGEPLIRPDCLDILEDLSAMGFALTVVTNGTALGRKAVERLNRLDLAIAVSLDTLDRATYHRIRGADQLPAVLQGIGLLEGFTGQRFVTCILSRQNLTHALDVLRFAKAQGLTPILGAYHWQAAGYGKADAGLIYDRAQAAQMFTRALESGLIPAGYLSDYARDTLTWLEGGKLAPCDAGSLSVVIDAMGNVSPCLGLPAAGNLAEHGLGQILATLDRQAIQDCSDKSTCNLLCARVVGWARRNPVAGLLMTRAQRAAS